MAYPAAVALAGGAREERAVSPNRWQPTEDYDDYSESPPSTGRPTSAPSHRKVVGRPGEDLSTKLRMISALHAGGPASEASKLRSVVEALFHVRYHASRSHVPAHRELASVLNTTDGVRRFLEEEPSLSWAAPYAPNVLRLLRKRAAGKNQPAVPNLPPMSAATSGESGSGKMKRNKSTASAPSLLLGGRLPPMGGGGVAAAGALFGERPSPEPPTWDTNARLAGIDPGIALALSVRVRELALEGALATAWIIVETCRDCHLHCTSFRHEERTYQSRFAALQEAIQEHFSVDLPVELLVSPYRSRARVINGAAMVPPVRIGAFEVFLCFPGSAHPFGALSLPDIEFEYAEAESCAGSGLAGGGFSAVCIASKLQTLSWPSPDEVIARLTSALPKLCMEVVVKTESGQVVPGVQVNVVASHERLNQLSSTHASSGKTDERGIAEIRVLPCVELKMTVSHDLLMEPQERKVTKTSGVAQIQEFIAETVVQMWCAEEGRDLVVYRSSPRAAPDPKLRQHMKPFKGRLLNASGEILLRCDSRGLVRGSPSLLADVARVALRGWKSGAAPADPVLDIEEPLGVTEYARLGSPPCEVAVVASCCGANVPLAEISIDGEHMGCTSASGAPLQCCVKSGDHAVQIRSKLLSEGLQVPFTVGGRGAYSLRAELPFTCLRFICVGRGGARRTRCRATRGLMAALEAGKCHSRSPSPQSRGRTPERRRAKRGSPAEEDGSEKPKNVADLWVVGGCLSNWCPSRGGPRPEDDVWMWNGHLHGAAGPPLAVVGGTLSGLMGEWEGSACVLSQALTAPASSPPPAASSSYGVMHVTCHAAAVMDGCSLCGIAQMMQSKMPAIWLGRLEEDPESVDAEEEERHMNVLLRTTCCRRGFSSSSVVVPGQEPVPSDESGCFILTEGLGDENCKQVKFKVDAIPKCLLPGNTCEYAASCKPTGQTRVELDISCKLWLWWVPPGEEDEDMENSIAYTSTPKSMLSSPKSEPGDEIVESMLWLAADSEHLPKNARPLSGILECPNAEEPERTLDGTLTGPFFVRQGQQVADVEADGCSPCLLAGLVFRAIPPAGFEYIPRDPTPLMERCQELGGCELSRMSACPVVMGYYRQLQPPPLCLSLCTSCCCRPWPEATAILQSHTSAKHLNEFGKVELRRKMPKYAFDDDTKVNLDVCIDVVPEALLPDCSRQRMVVAGVFERVNLDIPIHCLLYVYWIPPDEDDYDVDEDGLLRELAEGEEVVQSQGMLCVAADAEQIPDEAQPVAGLMYVPSAEQPQIQLDSTGSTFGPYLVEWPHGAKPPLDMLEDGLVEFAPASTAVASSGVAGSIDDASPAALNKAPVVAAVSSAVAAADAAVSDSESPKDDQAAQIDAEPAEAVGADAAAVSSAVATADATVSDADPPKDEPAEGAGAGQASAAGDQRVETPVAGVRISDVVETVGGDSEIVAPSSAMPPLGTTSADASFAMMPASPLSTSVPSESRGARCLLAGMYFDLQEPMGYYWKPKEPSPIDSRCAELGGCELPRLSVCPVAVGSFVQIEPPPLQVSLWSSCCCRPFTGARVTLLNHSSQTVKDESVYLRRKREKQARATFEVDVSGVPSSLLPRGSRRHTIEGSSFEPVFMPIEVTCKIWIYWIPPEESENGDLEDEYDKPDGKLYLAADESLIPDGALPLQCVVECKGAMQTQIRCDGSSMGPFEIKMSESLFEQNRNCPKGEGTNCLLETIKLHVKPIEGYNYRERDPMPLAEGCDERDHHHRCELQRLAKAPIEMGYFSPIFPPAYRFSLCTSCCRRGFDGAKATLLDHSSAVFDESGIVELQRRRQFFKERCDLVVQVDQVPLCLLPGASMRFVASCQPLDELRKDLSISCLVYVYWTPPEDELPETPASSSSSADSLSPGMVWMASDVEHLPQEILPIQGLLTCPSAETDTYDLDGSTAGPFHFKRNRSDRGTDCLLAEVECMVTAPPEGFVFQPREPSPFKERCAELGGCELQRLCNAPACIGYLKPVPPPPMTITLRTTCCDRPYPESGVRFNLRSIECDDQGVVNLRRKRSQKENDVEVTGVPAHFLPGSQTEHLIRSHPYQELSVNFDVAAKIWVYWVPPEPEEEEEEDSDIEPAEGMVFISANPEDIPDEALPLSCTVNCPGAEDPALQLDGTCTGPFELRREQRIPVGKRRERCLFAGLKISIPKPPPNYRFRPKEPSPFADRCRELGGCELSRLLCCPTAVGFLKPIDKKSRVKAAA